jgi:hypothetical protein
MALVLRYALRSATLRALSQRSLAWLGVGAMIVTLRVIDHRGQRRSRPRAR